MGIGIEKVMAVKKREHQAGLVHQQANKGMGSLEKCSESLQGFESSPCSATVCCAHEVNWVGILHLPRARLLMKAQPSPGLILQAELGLGVRAERRDGGLDWLF